MKDKTISERASTNFSIDAEGVNLNLLVKENSVPYFPHRRPPLHDTRHTHSWYELFCVEEGVLHAHVGEKIYHVAAGSILLIAPDVEHHTVIDEAEGALRYCFQFSAVFRKRTDTADTLQKLLTERDAHVLKADGACHGLVRLLSEAVTREESASVGCYLLALLLTCASLVHGKKKGTPTLSDDTESNRIYRIESICQSFFNERSISLALLASELHLSERQVERIFKRQYGCSFHDYITRLRMQEALAMLKDGVLVSDVADSVGYGSLSAFYRAFRFHYGCSPLAYLRK